MSSEYGFLTEVLYYYKSTTTYEDNCKADAELYRDILSQTNIRIFKDLYRFMLFIIGTISK